MRIVVARVSIRIVILIVLFLEIILVAIVILITVIVVILIIMLAILIVGSHQGNRDAPKSKNPQTPNGYNNKKMFVDVSGALRVRPRCSNTGACWHAL